jgi:hypothetical protein
MAVRRICRSHEEAAVMPWYTLCGADVSLPNADVWWQGGESEGLRHSYVAFERVHYTLSALTRHIRGTNIRHQSRWPTSPTL